MSKLWLVLVSLASLSSAAQAGEYNRYKCECALYFLSSPVSYPGWDSELYVFGRDSIDAEIAAKAECVKRPPVDDGIGHTYYPGLVKGSCKIARPE